MPQPSPSSSFRLKSFSFTGEVEAVVVPGTEGEFTVLKDHAPVMSVLKPGIVEIEATATAKTRLFVRGGFADVSPKGPHHSRRICDPARRARRRQARRRSARTPKRIVADAQGRRSTPPRDRKARSVERVAGRAEDLSEGSPIKASSEKGRGAALFYLCYAPSMAPPLLTLQQISLSFGGTALLTDAELSVSAGERLCLVGRNGSGKSTLLKIAAGLIEPDAGRRFLQPRRASRYLPQEPDFSGFETALAYVEAGLGPSDDPHRARLLLNELGLSGEEDPARLSGGEARRVALARVLAPEPDILASRRADQSSRSAGDRMARSRARTACARRSSSSAMIGAFCKICRAGRSGSIAASRALSIAALLEFEAWRDQMLEEEEQKAHKLERKIVDGGRLAALWRHREAQAQSEAARRSSQPAQGSWRGRARARPRDEHGQARRERSGNVGQARHRGEEPFESPLTSGRSSRISRSASCAAIGSASSAPMAPARRRSSIF